MQQREFTLPIKRCPICGATGTFHMKGRVDNVPYFGEIMSTSLNCSACKFKHADVMCLGEHEPTRQEFVISSEADMTVRVVKSSTGIVEIPELGVTIKPGPASEGYISNVEGVLDRIQSTLKLAIKKAEPKKRERGQNLLKKIQAIRKGKLKVKLIITDPLGNSTLVDERVKKRALSKRELKSLKISDRGVLERANTA
jgi:zinc finger protein